MFLFVMYSCDGLTRFVACAIPLLWLWFATAIFGTIGRNGAVIFPFLENASRDYQKEAAWTLYCLKM